MNALTEKKNRMNIVQKVRDAGVVGAGGAGFPTHIKINADADIVIANGSECEPLVQCDRQIMELNYDKVLEGLDIVVEATGAKKGVMAIKVKHGHIVEKLKSSLSSESRIELHVLEDFYPAGDEHVLVNLVTGRVVPEGGIPPDIGVVVCNVTTLKNITDAMLGIPVTERMVTVTGAVNKAININLPVGTSIKEAIELAGGSSVDRFEVIVGGPMMGYVEKDLYSSITKTTGSIIVLDAEHKLICMKKQDMSISVKKARSICCQCSHCTEMCPRNLLGHGIKPHKTIGTVAANVTNGTDNITSAFLCSQCGLCGFFSCVHDIMPFKVNKYLKEQLEKQNIKNPHKRQDIYAKEGFGIRRVPTERIIQRLGLSAFNKKAQYEALEYKSSRVVIPLKQHIGVPSESIVRVGESVAKGQLIARIPGEKLGSPIHASIDGRVVEITDRIAIEKQ